MLAPLGIERLYSSPYLRCLETIRPFAEHSGLNVMTDIRLEESIVAKGLIRNFHEVWEKSWNDFDYCLPECESSAKAQSRFVGAVQELARTNRGATIGVSTHGNVIALFLNHLDRSFTRHHADKIRNPDILRIEFDGSSFSWICDFAPPGLADLATHQSATPLRFAEAVAEMADIT